VRSETGRVLGKLATPASREEIFFSPCVLWVRRTTPRKEIGEGRVIIARYDEIFRKGKVIIFLKTLIFMT